MQQTTPVEFKPCSRAAPYLGRDVDRRRVNNVDMPAEKPGSPPSYCVRLDDSRWLPVNGEVPLIVRTLLRQGARRIVLDLAGVSGIDAAGVGELVRAYNHATVSHGVFRIVNPTPRVRLTLELFGLFGRLNEALSDTEHRDRNEDRDSSGAPELTRQ